MRTYELVLVFRPSLSESDRKKLLETVKSWVKNAKVTKEEDMGSKALAYKIKGELTGHYFNLHLEAESMDQDVEKRLLENESVLRHLLLRTK